MPILYHTVFGVSKGTVSDWEQGERKPDGSKRRLLQVAEQHPDGILEAAVGPGKKGKGRR